MTAPLPQGPGQPVTTGQGMPPGSGPNGQLPPFEPTTARWLNRERRVRDPFPKGGEPPYTTRWSKVLAHTGHYEQFAYGTDTPSDWPVRGLQKCLICSPQSGAITVDVDDEQAFAGTRTGRLIGRAQAWTAHGGGYHVVIDARGLSEADWPRQGPIAGADIKSKGFVPLPGCMHFDGQPYQPVYQPGPVVWWPELIAAICADLADQREHNRAGGGSGGGGEGGGHDGEVAGAVLKMVLRGLDKDQCYAEWLKIAVPRDPSWPFTADDFERHYGSAARKAEQIRAEEGDVTTDDGAAAWAAGERARLAAQAQATAPAPAGGPVSCAEAEAAFAKWLHDPDQVPTRLVLAAYAANMALDGDPVWLMEVGGSGIGKTERIMPLAPMPGVVMASTLTGEAALLSASPKRDRAKNATGGLLRQVGDRGVLVVKDFTSILSMSRDARAQVLAAFREIHDGRWDRHYGTDGGQVLHWAGHCGFITGCTTAIDKAHAVLDAMGTRFLFARLPDADGGAIGRSALAQVGQERQMRAELAEVTTGLLSHLGQPHPLHQGVQDWLIPLAAMAAQARSPVMRDYQGEIELVGDAEAPTRIIKQLGQLWRACGMLGLGEAESWEAVRRAGLDSIPKLRRAVLAYLARAITAEGGTQEWHSTTDISRGVLHPSRTTRRALEDLEAHGLVERNIEDVGDQRKNYYWALSVQALTWWNALRW
jgi:hypothetical protein